MNFNHEKEHEQISSPYRTQSSHRQFERVEADRSETTHGGDGIPVERIEHLVGEILMMARIGFTALRGTSRLEKGNEIIQSIFWQLLTLHIVRIFFS